MTSSRQHPALQRYLAELVRLRALSPDEMAQEVDEMAPLWVTLKVVPGL